MKPVFGGMNGKNSLSCIFQQNIFGETAAPCCTISDYFDSSVGEARRSRKSPRSKESPFRWQRKETVICCFSGGGGLEWRRPRCRSPGPCRKGGETLPGRTVGREGRGLPVRLYGVVHGDEVLCQNKRGCLTTWSGSLSLHIYRGKRYFACRRLIWAQSSFARAASSRVASPSYRALM